ncbi:glycosyltransferase [Devosia naphthalenivorans]|uniref:glycosyltransferase n=1 Tax=Devosia naphthalenivorans TaxID=2082392 RepID=UPI000D3C4E06|nr:glycosyltransferase [Devosia naphthalenivorans]
MNILFATTSLPHGQTTGGEIASQAFVDAMRKTGHFVQVFGFARDFSPPPRGSVSVELRAVETASAGLAKYIWLGRSLLTGRPYVCEKFRAHRYLDLLRRATRLGKADVLVIDHAQMGWLLPLARRLAKSVILVAHNHEAPLYAAEAANETRPLQRLMLKRDSHLLAHLEPLLARAADQVWTLSQNEQTAFSIMGGESKTSLMPLAGRSISPKDGLISPSFDIGLLGTWAWDVNGRGLKWFIDKVVPLLPDHVTICVAGRGSERVNNIHPNVTGLGYIEDPVSFMHQARVLAIPAVAGAGVQLKTIEAIASGTPTVSTTLGVRGLDDLPANVAIADAPEQFTEALLRQMLSAPNNDAAQAWASDRQARFESLVAAQLGRLDAAPASATPSYESALA